MVHSTLPFVFLTELGSACALEIAVAFQKHSFWNYLKAFAESIYWGHIAEKYLTVIGYLRSKVGSGAQQAATWPLTITAWCYVSEMACITRILMYPTLVEFTLYWP